MLVLGRVIALVDLPNYFISRITRLGGGLARVLYAARRMHRLRSDYASG